MGLDGFNRLLFGGGRLVIKWEIGQTWERRLNIGKLTKLCRQWGTNLGKLGISCGNWGSYGVDG